MQSVTYGLLVNLFRSEPAVGPTGARLIPRMVALSLLEPFIEGAGMTGQRHGSAGAFAWSGCGVEIQRKTAFTPDISKRLLSD